MRRTYLEQGQVDRKVAVRQRSHEPDDAVAVTCEHNEGTAAEDSEMPGLIRRSQPTLKESLEVMTLHAVQPDLIRDHPRSLHYGSRLVPLAVRRWDDLAVRLTAKRRLAATLPRYEDAEFTYAPIGATRGRLPDGYRHTRRRVRIGHSPQAFDRAANALLTWGMHRRSGLTVAVDGPAELGRTVVLGLGIGLSLAIPCRVVYVVDEPTRRGFAYGTLPDHPEQGEEAFVVEQDKDGSVWFEITAFSRPDALLVRLAGPLGRAIQLLATTRYERALASAADSQR